MIVLNEAQGGKEEEEEEYYKKNFEIHVKESETETASDFKGI